MQYVITGHCANFSVQFPDGRRGRQLLFKGQPVPATATPEEIAHHLSINAIAPVAGQLQTEPPAQEPTVTSTEGSAPDTGGGSEGDGEPDASGEGSGEQAPEGQSQTASVDPDVEQKRAEARAKLPTDGSKPDGRAGQAVWVEYLVTRGYDYDTLTKAEKKELMELANSLASA